MTEHQIPNESVSGQQGPETPPWKRDLTHKGLRIALPLIVILLGGIQVNRHWASYPGPVMMGPDAGSWGLNVHKVVKERQLEPYMPSRPPMLATLVGLHNAIFGEGNLVTAAHRVNAFFCVLAFVLLYFLVTKMFGMTVGFFSAVFGVLCTSWLRYVWQFNVEALVIPASLLAWLLGWIALERKSLIWAGIAGLGFMVFYLTHLLSIGYLILFILLIFVWPRLHKRLLFLVVFLLGSALTLAAVTGLWMALIGGGWWYFLMGFEEFFLLLVQGDAWGIGQGGGGGGGPHPGRPLVLGEAALDNIQAFIRSFSFVEGRYGRFWASGLIVMLLLGLSGFGMRKSQSGVEEGSRKWRFFPFEFGRNHLYMCVFLLPLPGHLFVRFIPHYQSPLLPMVAVAVTLGVYGILRLVAGTMPPGGTIQKVFWGAAGVLICALLVSHTARPRIPKIDEAAVEDLRIGQWVNENLPPDAEIYSNSLEITFHVTQPSIALPGDDYHQNKGSAQGSRREYIRVLHGPRIDNVRKAGKLVSFYLLVDEQKLTDFHTSMRAILADDPSRYGMKEVKRWEREEGDVALFELVDLDWSDAPGQALRVALGAANLEPTVDLGIFHSRKR